jgi:hypothetical protein
MNTFGEEFLADLETCVKTAGETRGKVLETWDPSQIAAPERHVACGVAHGLTHESIAYMLSRRNPALDRIASMLDLHLRTVHCVAATASAAAPIDVEKEQVWLFGWAWFDAYYEFLTDSLTLRSEFYKEHHTRFLALLERMLTFDPVARPRFRDILAEWIPHHDLLKSHQSDASATDADDDESVIATAIPATAVTATAASSSATAIPVTANEPRQPRRRFVLTAVVDPYGRRKTRKVHHS